VISVGYRLNVFFIGHRAKWPVLVKNLGEPRPRPPKADPNFSIDTMNSNWHALQYVIGFMDLNNVHVDLHDGHVDLHNAGHVDFAVWSCKYIGLDTCPSLDV
jgi:hypothetical protein